VRVARALVRQIAARTSRIRELESELGQLVFAYAPQLLAERGCGALTAAKLIGEIAGAERLSTDAKLARTSGAALSRRHRSDQPPPPRSRRKASSTARFTVSPSTKEMGR
jgi:transposase